MSKTANTPLSVTVPLHRHIRHGDAEYASLTIREPFIGDQLDVTEPGMGPGEVEVALVARLAGVPTEVVRAISLVDYPKIQNVVANFPYPPETSSGDASSASAKSAE